MEFRGVDDWRQFFDECQRSAFHMEVRDSYAEPAESEALRRFLNNEPPAEYDKSDWLELIRSMVGRGVAVSRIRVVTVPHTGYQRWLLSVTGNNVEAGEDIRYVPRHSVDPAIVPSDDWWLFDENLVAFNLSDSAGKPAGAGITTDPGIVAYCREVKNLLWPFATPYRDYHADQVNARK
ncbi:DUF6879 family protein [Nocardia sp. CA-120079]|uniref:DUF6879 family protein n=1 Tax=Nocardia sp. CA-120079 TaxID=3239974 RepID=UPI003D954854